MNKFIGLNLEKADPVYGLLAYDHTVKYFDINHPLAK